jgi:hypothetical protein
MAYLGAQPNSEPSYSHQTFYGFKLDKLTGGLTVDGIDDGSIKLPDSANVLDDGDYRDYFWSQNKVTYQWGSNGHIEVVYK